jgi:hypothetical protein
VSEASPEGAELLGFYKTPEGREVLRRAYSDFLRARNIGNAKAVLPVIAASSSRGPTPVISEDAEKELNAAKSALNRWAGGQRELWRDEEKSLRILKGLETEMMAVPEIRASLEEQAATERKKSIGRAFGSFFYGPDGDAAQTPHVRVIKANILGLHQIFHPKTSGDGKWDEPVLKSLNSDGWFIRFEEVVGETFLLVQMFKVSGLGMALDGGIFAPEGESERVGFRFRQSGFAFPLPSGEIHCVMADYGPPHYRTYNVWAPSSFEDLLLWQGERKQSRDIVFRYSDVPNYPDRPMPRNFPGRHIGNGNKVLRRPERMTERIVSIKLEEMNWSVIL